MSNDLQSLIDDATFDFSVGDVAQAIAKLQAVIADHPEASAAWHALSEFHLSAGELDAALASADRAYSLAPNDLFINTTLSRIWVAKGDKDRAEKYGAQAKMLSWKDQLQNPQNYQGGVS